MKRTAVFIAVAGAVAAFATAAVSVAATAAPSKVAPIAATGGAPDDVAHGVHITPLSAGTIPARVHTHSAGIEIETHGPRDMLVTSITVDPGGSFGWHTHPGPVLVSIGTGALTLYQPEGGRCVRTVVPAGKAFIEDGGDVHLARNEGSVPIVLNAIFLARTGTTEFLTAVPRPRGCHL